MSGSPPQHVASRQGRSALLVAALVVANLALACGPWLVRLSEDVSHVGPVASAFWRLTLAFPVLAVTSYYLPEPRVDDGRLVACVALAGLLFAGDLAAWHFGILQTRLANATLLGNVTAILFPAYGFIVARRWPSARQSAALALAAAGALLLVGRSYQLSRENIGGDLLCLLAGLCYTGYLVAVDRARRRLGPATTLTGAMVAGIPALLLLAFVLGEPIRPSTWWPLLLLACGSQLIGQGLILYAVARAEPLLVGVMLLVQPVVSAAIGWIVYRERLGWVDLAGALAVGGAVVLVRSAVPRLRVDEIGVSA